MGNIDEIVKILNQTGLSRKPGNIIYSGYETLSPLRVLSLAFFI